MAQSFSNFGAIITNSSPLQSNSKQAFSDNVNHLLYSFKGQNVNLLVSTGYKRISQGFLNGNLAYLSKEFYFLKYRIN